MRTLGIREMRLLLKLVAELVEIGWTQLQSCEVSIKIKISNAAPWRLHPLSLPIMKAAFAAYLFLFFMSLTMMPTDWQFPGVPRGERSRTPLLVSPLKWRFCTISHRAIVEQQCVPPRQRKVPTLAAYQTPGCWALVSPLLLGSLFLFPPSLLCHLFMTGARCHAILSQFWISLLLAILLGCPIHGKWTTPVAVGELRGKVQGTFFLLGLCVSCDSSIFRGNSSSSQHHCPCLWSRPCGCAQRIRTPSRSKASAPLKWASVVLKEPSRLSWGDSSHATQVTGRSAPQLELLFFLLYSSGPLRETKEQNPMEKWSWVLCC